MSGIEIAGLVLGAFPILLHALESYREGAEVLMDWWRIQRAYKKCRQDLKYHQLLFEGNIERFLLPLVVDEEELRQLMADPAGTGWEDRDLEQRLQDRLPKSYSLFLDIIGHINSLMELLKKDLGVNNPEFQARVNPDGQLIRANAARRDLLSIANFEFQANRLKFSLKKHSRERLFSQLQEAGDRMRNLLESSDQVANARRRGQLQGISLPAYRKLSHFWRHAQRLYEALSKAWQCDCISHIASLELEHRTPENLEFKVLFDLTAVFQRLTKIKVIETSNGPSIHTAQPTSKTTGRPPQKVRWVTSTPNPDSSQNLAQISNLCGKLSGKCADCIGFLEEDEYRFAVYPALQSPSALRTPTKTLEDLLTATDVPTRRKRYCLALTLASSYLQLGATPWLNTQLRKDSIVFLVDSNNHETAILEHPYIRQEMSGSSNSRTPDALATLGIRLLELCFGKPLEATQYRKQLPSGDAISAPVLDYAAAIQWSKHAGEEAGPEFAEAIDWCLHTKEVSDGSWRKDLLQNVVIPLDACHRQVSQKASCI